MPASVLLLIASTKPSPSTLTDERNVVTFVRDGIVSSWSDGGIARSWMTWRASTDNKKVAGSQRPFVESASAQRKRDCGTVFSSPGSVEKYAASCLASACVNGRAMPIMMALLRPKFGLPLPI